MNFTIFLLRQTLSCKCLKSIDFIILLESIAILLCKLLDRSEEGRQVSRFINLVVESNYKDDDIFEPERGFSGVLILL